MYIFCIYGTNCSFNSNCKVCIKSHLYLCITYTLDIELLDWNVQMLIWWYDKDLIRYCKWSYLYFIRVWTFDFLFVFGDELELDSVEYVSYIMIWSYRCCIFSLWIFDLCFWNICEVRWWDKNWSFVCDDIFDTFIHIWSWVLIN